MPHSVPALRRLHITLRQLEVFTAVAREGTTRAAAGMVARSQSAASSALADLETAMNAELFDRIGRRLVLNENGRALLPAAVSLLEQAGDLEDVLTGSPASQLSIAASMTIGEHILPTLISDWRREHAAGTVSMQVTNTVGVLDALADLRADIGFIEGPQTRSGLRLRAWFSDEMVVVAASAHPLTRGRVSRSKLRAASWAMREPGSGTREAAERWLLDQLGEIQIDYELGTPAAIKALVRSGIAVACLPRHAVARELAAGELVELNTGLPAMLRRLTIVTHSAKPLGPTATSFLQHCTAARPPAGASASRTQKR